MLGPHLSVQCCANCLQQLIRLGGFMACDDLCWTDSQTDTCDDLYKRQQPAVTWRGGESKDITYKESRASNHLEGQRKQSYHL